MSYENENFFFRGAGESGKTRNNSNRMLLREILEKLDIKDQGFFGISNSASVTRKLFLESLSSYCNGFLARDHETELHCSKAIAEEQELILACLIEPLMNMWDDVYNRSYKGSHTSDFYTFLVFFADTILLLSHSVHVIMNETQLKHVPMIKLEVFTGLTMMVTEMIHGEDWHVSIKRDISRTAKRSSLATLKGLVILTRALLLTTTSLYGTGITVSRNDDGPYDGVKFVKYRSSAFTEEVTLALASANTDICKRALHGQTDHSDKGKKKRSPKLTGKKFAGANEKFMYIPFYPEEGESANALFWELSGVMNALTQFVCTMITIDSDAAANDLLMYKLLAITMPDFKNEQQQQLPKTLGKNENDMAGSEEDEMTSRRQKEALQNRCRLERYKKEIQSTENCISLCNFIIQHVVGDYIFLLSRDAETALSSNSHACALFQPSNIPLDLTHLKLPPQKSGNQKEHIFFPHVVLPVVDCGDDAIRPVTTTSAPAMSTKRHLAKEEWPSAGGVRYAAYPTVIELASSLIKIVEDTLRAVDLRHSVVGDEAMGVYLVSVPQPPMPVSEEGGSVSSSALPAEADTEFTFSLESVVEDKHSNDKHPYSLGLCFCVSALRLSVFSISFTTMAVIHDVLVLSSSVLHEGIVKLVLSTYIKVSHVLRERFLSWTSASASRMIVGGESPFNGTPGSGADRDNTAGRSQNNNNRVENVNSGERGLSNVLIAFVMALVVGSFPDAQTFAPLRYLKQVMNTDSSSVMNHRLLLLAPHFLWFVALTSVMDRICCCEMPWRFEQAQDTVRHHRQQKSEKREETEELKDGDSNAVPAAATEPHVFVDIGKWVKTSNTARVMEVLFRNIIQTLEGWGKEDDELVVTDGTVASHSTLYTIGETVPVEVMNHAHVTLLGVGCGKEIFKDALDLCIGKRKKINTSDVIWKLYLLHLPAVAATAIAWGSFAPWTDNKQESIGDISSTLPTAMISSQTPHVDPSFEDFCQSLRKVFNPSVFPLYDSALITIFVRERQEIIIAQRNIYKKDYTVNSVISGKTLDNLVYVVVSSLQQVNVRNSLVFACLKKHIDEKKNLIEAMGVSETGAAVHHDSDHEMMPIEFTEGEGGAWGIKEQKKKHVKKEFTESEVEVEHKRNLYQKLENELHRLGKSLDVSSIENLHYEGLQLIQKRSAYQLAQESASADDDATGTLTAQRLIFRTGSGMDSLSAAQQKLELLAPRARVYYAAVLSILHDASEMLLKSFNLNSDSVGAAQMMSALPSSDLTLAAMHSKHSHAHHYSEVHIRNIHALAARTLLQAPGFVSDICQDALCDALRLNIEEYHRQLRIELKSAADATAAIATERVVYARTLSLANISSANALCMQCLYMSAAQSATVKQLRIASVSVGIDNEDNAENRLLVRTMTGAVMNNVNAKQPLEWIYGSSLGKSGGFFHSPEHGSSVRRKKRRTDGRADASQSHESQSVAAEAYQGDGENYEYIIPSSTTLAVFFENDTLKSSNRYSHFACRLLSMLLHGSINQPSRSSLWKVPFRTITEFFLNVPAITNYMWSVLHRDICLSSSDRRCKDGIALLATLAIKRSCYALHAFTSLLYFSSIEKNSTREEAIKQLSDLLAPVSYHRKQQGSGLLFVNKLCSHDPLEAAEYEAKTIEVAVVQADRTITEIRELKVKSLRYRNMSYETYLHAQRTGLSMDTVANELSNEGGSDHAEGGGNQPWYALSFAFIQELHDYLRLYVEAATGGTQSEKTATSSGATGASYNGGVESAIAAENPATMTAHSPDTKTRVCELLIKSQDLIKRWSTGSEEGSPGAAFNSAKAPLVSSAAIVFAALLLKRRISLLVMLINTCPQRSPILLQKLLDIYSCCVEVIDVSKISFEGDDKDFIVMTHAKQQTREFIIPAQLVGAIQYRIVSVTFASVIYHSSNIHDVLTDLFGNFSTRHETLPAPWLEGDGKSSITFTVPNFSCQQFFLSSVMPKLRSYPKGGGDLLFKILSAISGSMRRLSVSMNEWYINTFINHSLVKYNISSFSINDDDATQPQRERAKICNCFNADLQVTKLRREALTGFFQLASLLLQHCRYLFSHKSALCFCHISNNCTSSIGNPDFDFSHHITSPTDNETDLPLSVFKQAIDVIAGTDGVIDFAIPGDVRMLLPVLIFLPRAEIREVVVPALMRLHRIMEYKFEHHDVLLNDCNNLCHNHSSTGGYSKIAHGKSFYGDNINHGQQQHLGGGVSSPTTTGVTRGIMYDNDESITPSSKMALQRLLHLALPINVLDLALSATVVKPETKANTNVCFTSTSVTTTAQDFSTTIPTKISATALTSENVSSYVLEEAHISLMHCQPAATELVIQELLYFLLNKCDLPGMDFNVVLTADGSTVTDSTVSSFQEDEMRFLLKMSKLLVASKSAGLAAANKALLLNPDNKEFLLRAISSGELLKEILLQLDGVKRRLPLTEFNYKSFFVKSDGNSMKRAEDQQQMITSLDCVLFGDVCTMDGIVLRGGASAGAVGSHTAGYHNTNMPRGREGTSSLFSKAAGGLGATSSSGTATANSAADIVRHANATNNIYSLLTNKSGYGFLRMLLTRMMNFSVALTASSKSVLLPPLSITAPGMTQYVLDDSWFNHDTMVTIKVTSDVESGASSRSIVVPPRHFAILPCWSFMLLTFSSHYFEDALSQLTIEDEDKTPYSDSTQVTLLDTSSFSPAMMIFTRLQQAITLWVQGSCMRICEAIRSTSAAFITIARNAPRTAGTLKTHGGAGGRIQHNLMRTLLSFVLLNFWVVKATPVVLTAQSSITNPIESVDVTCVRPLLDYIRGFDSGYNSTTFVSKALAVFSGEAVSGDTGEINTSILFTIALPDSPLINCKDLIHVIDYMQRRSASSMAAALANQYASISIPFSYFWSVTPIELMYAVFFMLHQVSSVVLPKSEIMAPFFGVNATTLAGGAAHPFRQLALAEKLTLSLNTRTNACAARGITAPVFATGAANNSYGTGEAITQFREKSKQIMSEAVKISLKDSIIDVMLAINKEITAHHCFTPIALARKRGMDIASVGVASFQHHSQQQQDLTKTIQENTKMSCEIGLLECFIKTLTDRSSWMLMESIILSLPDRHLLVLMLSRPLLFLLFFERYGNDPKYGHVVAQLQQLMSV